MNKDIEGNEYTCKIPQTNDWGTITGMLVPSKYGGARFVEIDPESGNPKTTAEE